jgi:betaine reductase
MTGRAAVVAASLVLEHVPDLVRYGSKPSREPAQLDAIAGALRSFDETVAYPPNQVVIGNLAPEDLWDLPRPWWKHPRDGSNAAGAWGEVMDQPRFLELMASVDRFDLVRLGATPGAGQLPLFDDGRVVGAFAPAHESDESLSAQVLLENVSIKASAVHAVRDLLARTGVDPSSITHAIGCGEEAIGDRYQRGGGNLAKAVAEQCGLSNASGIDVKSFCAAPVHALVVAASMIEAGVEDAVLVLAGGSLAKLGMKFEGALTKGFPILEDVLAGMAVLLAPSDGSNGPVLRTDAVGRMPVSAATAPQAQLEALVGAPLDALGISITDVDVYSTEIHNPEITEPQGGGDVADRNYKMLAGLGVVRGELAREDIAGFARAHGMPGFAPTQAPAWHASTSARAGPRTAATPG